MSEEGGGRAGGDAEGLEQRQSEQEEEAAVDSAFLPIVQYQGETGEEHMGMCNAIAQEDGSGVGGLDVHNACCID